MTTKEKVASEIKDLTPDELEKVAKYVAFIKFRSRLTPMRPEEEERLAALYGEFAKEDRAMAEEGMADYAAQLGKEDVAWLATVLCLPSNVACCSLWASRR